jgi:succinoglycan biosynthesis transport protein ExoP
VTVGENALERVQTEDGSQFDVRQILPLLLRHKWTIAGIFVTCVAAAVLLTLSMAKVYEAEVTLEYDANPPRPLGGQVEDIAALENVHMGLEWTQTQNAIIASRAVALKVVEHLALHRDASFMGVSAEKRAGWKGVDKETAAKQLLSRLAVKQDRNTRIARIIVNDGDPQRAAVIANAIADAYMNWLMDERMGSTVQAVEWLSGQLDDASKKLSASEHALYDFRRENNVLSMSLQDQRHQVSATISSFNQELSAITKQRVALEAKLRQLEEAASDPTTTRAGLIAENQAVVDMRSNYLQALSELQSKAAVYGPNHPVMLQLRSQVEVLSKALREEVDGMVATARSRVREVRDIEAGIQQAMQKAQSSGMELSLREIDNNRLERERANNERLYGVLLQRTTETSLTRLLRVLPVRLVDRAVPATKAVSPNPLVNVSLGGFIGLLAGIALVFVRVRMDRSVSSPAEIEALGTTVLGLVPSIANDGGTVYGNNYYGRKRNKRRKAELAPESVAKDLVVHTHPQSAVAECCRTIRTNVAFMSTDTPLKSLVVTSPGPSEGKSTLAISLAITMANSGRRVALVDTDLRRPRIHRALGLRGNSGVTTLLAGEASLTACLQATDIPGLTVLPSGVIPPNPSELLHTARFERLLGELEEHFDLVILDSPPIGVVIDAAIIGPRVGGAIIVAKAERTTRDALRHALRQMRDVGTNVLGCVLNDVDLSKQSGYGGYYYYRGGYHYASGPDQGGGPDGGSSDVRTTTSPMSPPAQ